MRFEDRLVASAARFETRLDRMFEPAGAAMSGVPERLAAAMRHAVMSGGKRIRPFLLLQTATMFGVDVDRAMPAALALELVHCYSLVHDDLPVMDNDVLRRGRPSVWKAYDEWTAILAGDALLTLAFEVLTRASLHGDGGQADAPVVVRLTAELARAAGAAGMVGGQCLDLEADKLERPPTPDADHVRHLQAMKTGALFRFACLAGAMLGNAQPAEEKALLRFGDALGSAFQLADDLLDAEGDAATVGKATGKDAAAGKATLIGLMGQTVARQELARVEAEGMRLLVMFESRADVLRQTLRFASARQR